MILSAIVDAERLGRNASRSREDVRAGVEASGHGDVDAGADGSCAVWTGAAATRAAGGTTIATSCAPPYTTAHARRSEPPWSHATRSSIGPHPSSVARRGSAQAPRMRPDLPPPLERRHQPAGAGKTERRCVREPRRENIQGVHEGCCLTAFLTERPFTVQPGVLGATMVHY